MKIISWNVNGLKHIKSQLLSLINKEDPDIICLQETRCKREVIEYLPFKYKKICIAKNKKGYSGVLIASKFKPLKVYKDTLSNEGRLIIFEFERIRIINTYFPNTMSGREEYRIKWDKSFNEYISKLTDKELLIFGDLNVISEHSRKEYNFRNMINIPKSIIENFHSMLEENKLADIYRENNPNITAYTWILPKSTNIGARIDFVLGRDKLMDINVLNYPGSDHKPLLCLLPLDKIDLFVNQVEIIINDE